ncbi:DUF2867 domain-containing protein [Kitasatospora sp. NPDC018058]|uniref:DUF2867 domain-containing protein n=1 Tax=Kitasatospora sp. NPDC018058 TaxID=3364025 RepID=UPI0037BF3131
MYLPNTAHETRPWLIHQIAPDFRLEDVWALPTPGGPDGFTTLVSVLQDGDFQQDAPPVARMLWQLRWKLGAALGLDRDRGGLDTRVRPLRHRLPPTLREAAAIHPGDGRSPFTFLYQSGNERVAEIANRTMHGVVHLGWVPDEQGGWRGQMAVLVNPNGRLGTAYMAAIRPFRHQVVCPALMRSWERRWQRQWEHDTRPAPTGQHDAPAAVQP